MIPSTIAAAKRRQIEAIARLGGLLTNSERDPAGKGGGGVLNKYLWQV